MQRVLPKMDLVTLRSPMGVRYLTSTMGCSSAQLREGGDDGLAYPQISSVSDDAMRIGVSLRVTNYAGRISNSVRQALQDGLQRVSKEMGAGLLSVPIEPDDSLAVAELLQRARTSKGKLGLDDLIDRIAQCRLVVAGSYHAAVFALAQGKPALCLAFSDYYKSKFEGLCEQFPKGCVSLEPETFSPASFRKELTSLWHAAPGLSNEIITTAQYLVELNRGHYREFTAMFKG
jgi:colanic acid/amylovoran biosynthesis protein